MSILLRKFADSVSYNSKDRSSHIYTSPKYRFVALTLITVLAFSGCTVGPKYQKPTAQAPQAYARIPTAVSAAEFLSMSPSDQPPDRD